MRRKGKKEHRFRIKINVWMLLFVAVAVLVPGVKVEAFYQNEEGELVNEWSGNILKNSNPSSLDDWTTSSGVTYATDEEGEGCFFRKRFDFTTQAFCYQQVDLDSTTMKKANKGYLSLYACMTAGRPSPSNTSVTTDFGIMFYNKDGKLYDVNQGKWIDYPFSNFLVTNSSQVAWDNTYSSSYTSPNDDLILYKYGMCLGTYPNTHVPHYPNYIVSWKYGEGIKIPAGTSKIMYVVHNMGVYADTICQQFNLMINDFPMKDDYAPRISGVSTEGLNENGVLKAGDTFSITVGFNEKIELNKTPTITLSNGVVLQGSLASNSSTNSVTFSYTATLGEDTNELTMQDVDFSGIVDDVDQLATKSPTYNDKIKEVKDALNNYHMKIDTIAPDGHLDGAIPSGFLNGSYKQKVVVTDDILSGIHGSGVSEMWSYWRKMEFAGGDSMNIPDPVFPESPNVQITNGIGYVNSPSSSGAYMLFIKIRDKAGNERINLLSIGSLFSYDIDTPEISITTTNIEGTNKKYKADITTTDAGGSEIKTKTYVWKNNQGIQVASGSLGATLTYPSASGTYNLTVTVTDNAGNQTSKTENDIYVDKEGPTIAFTNVPTSYVKAATLTATAIDTLSGVKSKYYQWTNVAASPNAEDTKWIAAQVSNNSFNTPTETGMWYLHIKAVDYAGNISIKTSNNCPLDNTAPEISITPDGNEGSEGQSSYQVTATIKDTVTQSANLTVSYAVVEDVKATGITYTPVTGNGTEYFQFVVAPTNKNKYLLVKAADACGNEKMYTSKIFTADTTAPTGSLTISGNGYTNQPAVTLALTATDNYVQVDDLDMQVTVDGQAGNWETFAASKTVSMEKTEGEHVFKVQYKDLCGNLSPVYTGKIIYDVTKPELNITYSTEEPTNGDVTVSATVTPADDTITSAKSHVFTSNGNFTFTAVDKAGNTAQMTAEVDWIDKEAPTISVTSEEADAKPHQDASVEITASDDETGNNDISKIYYRYGTTENMPEKWSEYEDIVEMTGLDGTYQFEAYAVDGVGNVSAVVTKTILMDNTVPTAEISYDPTGRTAQNVTATISFDEENVTVDNGDNGTNYYVFLDNDTFTFEFHDAAGNTGMAEATVDWIDRTAPEATVVITDEDLNTVEERTWVHYNLLVTIRPSANAAVKEISFNGKPIASAEGITETGTDTYKVTTYGTINYTLKDNETQVESNGSVQINIDKEVPICSDKDVIYSTTDWTRDDVQVSIHPKDNLSPITYYTLDEDGNKMEDDEGSTYLFEKNGSYTFLFADAAGNEAEKTVTISNIDREVPKAAITYKTEDGADYNLADWTNQSVIATVSFEDASPVTVTNNEGKKKYTFASNGKMTFQYRDAAGNTGSITAVIDKIDKTAPDGYVTIDKEGWTNTDVKAILHASDDASGTSDMKYTFTENEIHVFKLKDVAGNVKEISYTMDKIDKTKPEISIYYSPGNEGKTAFSVYATATADESVRWANTSSHRFDVNGEYDFTATDRAGNATTKTAKVDWIDNELPEVELVYSTTDATKEDVTVELKTKNEDDVILVSNNHFSRYHTFTENGEFTFEYTNSAGTVTGTKTAQVNWIDRALPQLTATYDKTELTKEDVTVTLTSSKEVTWPNGVVKNEDGSVSYTFTENNKIQFFVKDVLGNEGSIILDVDYIDKEAPVITLEKSKESLALRSTFDPMNGVKANDAHETEDMLEVTNTVDTTKEGVYTVIYKAVDAVGNTTTREKKVIVYDPEAFHVILDNEVVLSDEIVLEENKLHFETVQQGGGLLVKILPGKKKMGAFKKGGTDISAEIMSAESYSFPGAGYYTLYVQDDERDTKLITVYVPAA